MAVLDQSYRRWTGAATGYAQRILVIPRYDALEILEKRTWLLAWLACLVPPLGLGLYVYAAANMSTLRALAPALLSQFTLPLPGARAFEICLKIQCWMLTAFAVLVGPPLATRDFANGAMPLYLSKSLRRWDYVLGRCAVLATMLSLASWIPYLLIFLLECGMAPAEWRSQNWGLFGDIIAGTIPTVLLLTIAIVAVGAVVQRANLARAALLFLLLGVKPLVLPLQVALGSPRVQVLSPTNITGRLREVAFEAPEEEAPIVRTRAGVVPEKETELSGTLATLALAGWLVGGLAIIARRVRPVEVVR